MILKNKVVFRDAHGVKINCGDIVMLDVYELILSHETPTTMLGKIWKLPIDSPYIPTHSSMNIEVSLGHPKIPNRYRRGSDLLVVNDMAQEFEDQIKTYDLHLMLHMFEW